MTSKLPGLIPSSDSNLQLVSVNDVTAALGIGRTKFYELVAEHRITPVKLGRRTLIKVSDLQGFIAALPSVGGTQ